MTCSELSKENYRAYVHIEVKRGQRPSVIYQQLCDSSLNDIPSQATVFKWCKEHIEDTKTSRLHEPRSGHPSSSCTAANETVCAAPTLSKLHVGPNAQQQKCALHLYPNQI